MGSLRVLANLGVVAVLSQALFSCSGAKVASELAKTPEFTPKGETKCGVTRSQAQPLIVEWPEAERGKLESLAKRHVVAVKYIGCDMQILGQCTAPGVYGYSALNRKKSRVKMRDADELYANIPVYAAKFEGTLQTAGELNVAMTIVGRYEAARGSVRLDQLQGDCEGATHVVSALTVGAFEFFAGADATVGVGVGVGGVGAGARSMAQRETLTEDGDKALCDKSTSEDKRAPEGCGALLRVEVVPLGEAKRAEPVCPSGTKWDGAQCVRTNVVTQIQCPSGTRLEGQQCVGNVTTSCAAGMHFVAGTGCVPNTGVVAPTPPPGPAGAAFNAAVSSVISGMAPGFRRCYNKGLAQDPTMVGSIRVTAKLGSKGEVLSATPSGGGGLSDKVVACVSERVRDAVFPSPEGEAYSTVVIPVTFKSQ